MILVIGATLWIVGLIAAVLFAVGVPFFFGLLIFDVITARRTAKSAPESVAVPEPVRPMAAPAMREYGRIA